MNSKEVSMLVGVGFKTFTQWEKKGEFPRSRQIGKQTVWMRTDIEDWHRRSVQAGVEVLKEFNAQRDKIAAPAIKCTRQLSTDQAEYFMWSNGDRSTAPRENIINASFHSSGIVERPESLSVLISRARLGRSIAFVGGGVRA